MFKAASSNSVSVDSTNFSSNSITNFLTGSEVANFTNIGLIKAIIVLCINTPILSPFFVKEK